MSTCGRACWAGGFAASPLFGRNGTLVSRHPLLAKIQRGLTFFWGSKTSFCHRKSTMTLSPSDTARQETIMSEASDLRNASSGVYCLFCTSNSLYTSINCNTSRIVCKQILTNVRLQLAACCASTLLEVINAFSCRCFLAFTVSWVIFVWFKL